MWFYRSNHTSAQLQSDALPSLALHPVLPRAVHMPSGLVSAATGSGGGCVLLCSLCRTTLPYPAVGTQRMHGKLTRHDAARAAEGALASLSASQPATLLGWFVCRSGTQLAASAREQVRGGSDHLFPERFT